MKNWGLKTLRMIGFAAIALVIFASAAYAFDVPVVKAIGAALGLGGAGAGGLGMVGAATAQPVMDQRPTVLPFRQNTRQKIASLAGTMSYSLGGRAQVTLPQIGYLSKIYLRFNGTLTFSGGATPAKFAPYSIFNRVQVDLNSNKQTLVDASGYQLFLLNSVRKKNARLDQGTDSDFYVFPSSGSAQTFRATLEVPIAVSDGNNFMNGLINLQAPELQCNVTVQFASALTDIADTVTAATGSVDVIYEYYEVPDPSQVQQPFLGLHKILAQTNVITGTGENRYTVPRGGKILRLIHVLECNGAKSDAYDKQEIILNQSQGIYDVPKWASKFRNRQMYGYTLPTGTIVWDFMNAYDIAEESDQRDVLNTERVTTTESVVTVTAGTTLGSNNNFLHTLREIYQVPS